MLSGEKDSTRRTIVPSAGRPLRASITTAPGEHTFWVDRWIRRRGASHFIGYLDFFLCLIGSFLRGFVAIPRSVNSMTLVGGSLLRLAGP